MEFWIGLSVGLHLGKVISEHLEKFAEAYGPLDSGTEQKIQEIEGVESQIGSILVTAVE